MVHPIQREPYSWRTDESVPDFDDKGPLVVMDGDCALCSVGARMIARLDRRKEFRICRAQSALGRALLCHLGLHSHDPDTWLLLSAGRAHGSFDAVILVGRRLGGVGWLLQPLRLLPCAWRDWLYRCLARNRYRIFGRTDLCDIPDPALRERVIE